MDYRVSSDSMDVFRWFQSAFESNQKICSDCWSYGSLLATAILLDPMDMNRDVYLDTCRSLWRPVRLFVPVGIKPFLRHHGGAEWHVVEKMNELLRVKPPQKGPKIIFDALMGFAVAHLALRKMDETEFVVVCAQAYEEIRHVDKGSVS